MLDETTGTWWQQVSGKAVLGALKGTRLQPVFYEELTFGDWKKENPNGRVLMPEAETSRKNRYASADWEKEIAKLPVTSAFFKSGQLPARTIVIGLSLNNASRAYPQNVFAPVAPINDVVGGTPVVLIMDADKKSIRCFVSQVDQMKLEIFAKPGAKPQWFDSETGSEWNFEGQALSGKLQGKQLQKLPILKDYWFDWKTYHPATSLYTAGHGVT